VATILITGAAGTIGTSLRDRLSAHSLRLTDIRQLPTALADNEIFVQCALADEEQLTEIAQGADLVVHLGGLLFSDSFDDYVEANIRGTDRLLSAAARAGVSRVLYASTNHVVGYTPAAGITTTTELTVQPDGIYGASKAAAEALCSLYADNHGMTIVSARILSFLEKPTSLRTLGTWLSPDDTARLVEACLVLDRPGHHLLWGVSRNTRGWADLAEGEALGYFPQDDGENFADEVLARTTGDEEQQLIAIGGRQAPRVLELSLGSNR
jgi:uronate dehydrogenase